MTDTDRLAAALRCTEPPMSPDAFQAEADAAAIIAADPTLICPDPADHQVEESITVNGHHYVHVAACSCPEMVAATAALEGKP